MIFTYVFPYKNIKFMFKKKSFFLIGWGVTHHSENGKKVLLVSDGSNQIHHVDPEDFHILKSVEVFNKNKQPIDRLNE